MELVKGYLKYAMKTYLFKKEFEWSGTVLIGKQVLQSVFPGGGDAVPRGYGQQVHPPSLQRVGHALTAVIDIIIHPCAGAQHPGVYGPQGVLQLSVRVRIRERKVGSCLPVFGGAVFEAQSEYVFQAL